MSEAVHISHIKLYQDEGPIRRAYINDFEEPFYYGHNEGVKEFYGGSDDYPEQPATLDHVVAATAG